MPSSQSQGNKEAFKKREGYLNLKQRLDLRDSLSRASHPEWNNKPFTNQQAIFVMVLLLSGLRKDEARLLRWEHISFDDRTITIPETKNGKTHLLPMTSKMRELLEQVHDDSEWVFESPRLKGKPASMSRVVERISEDLGTSFTHHDIRRTVATLLAERGLSSDQIGVLTGLTPTKARHRIIYNETSSKLFPSWKILRMIYLIQMLKQRNNNWYSKASKNQ